MAAICFDLLMKPRQSPAKSQRATSEELSETTEKPRGYRAFLLFLLCRNSSLVVLVSTADVKAMFLYLHLCSLPALLRIKTSSIWASSLSPIEQSLSSHMPIGVPRPVSGLPSNTPQGIAPKSDLQIIQQFELVNPPAMFQIWSIIIDELGS